jgi:hypothetical protein
VRLRLLLAVACILHACGTLKPADDTPDDGTDGGSTDSTEGGTDAANDVDSAPMISGTLVGTQCRPGSDFQPVKNGPGNSAAQVIVPVFEYHANGLGIVTGSAPFDNHAQARHFVVVIGFEINIDDDAGAWGGGSGSYLDLATLVFGPAPESSPDVRMTLSQGDDVEINLYPTGDMASAQNVKGDTGHVGNAKGSMRLEVVFGTNDGAVIFSLDGGSQQIKASRATVGTDLPPPPNVTVVLGGSAGPSTTPAVDVKYKQVCVTSYL